MRLLAPLFLLAAAACAQQNIVIPPQPQNLFSSRMHYMGTWSSSTTYASQDVVLYSGAAYISLAPVNLNNNPSLNPSWWVALPGSGNGGPGGGGTWGSITGTLSNQTDLANALAGKEPTIAAGSTTQFWRGDKTWQSLQAAVWAAFSVTAPLNFTSGVITCSTCLTSSSSIAPGQLGQGGAGSGQVLAWNGSAWAPASLSGVGTVTHTAGALTSGVVVTGNTGADIATQSQNPTVDGSGNFTSTAAVEGTSYQSTDTTHAGLVQLKPGTCTAAGGSGLLASLPASGTYGLCLETALGSQAVLVDSSGNEAPIAAHMASQLGDLAVVKSSSTVLAVGTNCSTATPCNVRFGTTISAITSGATVTVSAGTGNALIYVDQSLGIVAASTTLTLACSGCTVVSGSSLPAGVAPIWFFSAASGAWTTGSDSRGFLSGNGSAAAVTVSGTPTAGQMAAFANASQIETATGHMMAGPLACADSSGSGTAQVCNTSPTFTPVAGDCILYSTTTANTGAGLTLNVDSLGNKSVAKWQGVTTLASGDVAANNPVQACYNGTVWNLATIANAPSGGPGGGSAPTMLAWNPWAFGYGNSSAGGAIVAFTAGEGVVQSFQADTPLAISELDVDVATASGTSCTGGVCGLILEIATPPSTSGATFTPLCVTTVGTSGNGTASLNINATGVKRLTMASGTDVSGGVCSLPGSALYSVLVTTDSTALTLVNYQNGGTSGTGVITQLYPWTFSPSSVAISSGNGGSIAFNSSITGANINTGPSVAAYVFEIGLNK